MIITLIIIYSCIDHIHDDDDDDDVVHDDEEDVDDDDAQILNLSIAFYIRPSILKTSLFNERNSNRSNVYSMRWNEIACNESLEKKLKGLKEMF